MRVRCKNEECGKFSCISKGTRYCELCGARYPYDIPALVDASTKATDRVLLPILWSLAGFMGLTIIAIVLMIVYPATFMPIMNSPVMTLVWWGAILAWSAGLAFFRYTGNKKKFPIIFNNPDIQL
ncbi:MAG: hypothetical protein UX72_C0004G0027 [Parcubacteria group bacterium GW2011_GWA2_47_10]|nr:MAG: hypothetical protein UX72_C0004G0027 [Parcubacteria group bacterium GW2011_GWA2_47_10]